MKKSINATIVNHLVTVGIILTLLALAFTPLGMTAFFKSALSMTGTNMDMVVTAAIYVCAVPYVATLFSLKKMCKLIVLNQPFSDEMPKCLKRISLYSFCELVLFNVVTLVLYYGYDIFLYALTIFPCIIVSFVALTVGLLSLVFSRLFETAIDIKNENDQTI